VLSSQNIDSPLRSLVFHGRSQSAADVFVPQFTLKQCVWNLSVRVEFPSLQQRRTDDGTLYVAVADRSTHSDSGADLAFWWPSLEVILPQLPKRAAICTAQLIKRVANSEAHSFNAQSIQLTAASRAVAARVLPC
jgi:hypothetical protein